MDIFGGNEDVYFELTGMPPAPEIRPIAPQTGGPLYTTMPVNLNKGLGTITDNGEKKNNNQFNTPIINKTPPEQTMDLTKELPLILAIGAGILLVAFIVKS